MIDVSKLVQGVSHEIAYPEIERVARQFLMSATKHGDGKSMTTAELAEALLPPALLRGPNMQYAFKRLKHGLTVCAQHGLADCADRATRPVKLYNKMVYPWRWHAPDPNYRTTRDMVWEDLYEQVQPETSSYTARDKLDDISGAHQWKGERDGKKYW